VNLVEWLLVVAIASPIVAYAIGGVLHVSIDYVHGKRMLRAYWDKTDAKIAGITESVVDAVAEKVRTIVPSSPVSSEAMTAAFETFLRSEAGVEWGRELAELSSRRILDGVRDLTTSRAGANARTSQSQMVRMLTDSIRFDNQVLQGLWVMAPTEEKHRFLMRVASAIRRNGFALVPVDGPLALEAGGSSEGEIAPENWPG